MLGDVVFEGQGKAVGMRVLKNGSLEVTGIMAGVMLGEEFSGPFTYVDEPRMDGTVYGEIRGITNSKNGLIGTFKANGNGIIRQDGSQRAVGALCFSCPPGKYAELNGYALIYEFEADKEGNVRSKAWAWK